MKEEELEIFGRFKKSKMEAKKTKSIFFLQSPKLTSGRYKKESKYILCESLVKQ